MAIVGVEIPFGELSKEALQGLIEALVLSEGTDYGEHEAGFATKVEQVRRQLESGEAKIYFDPEEETCAIFRLESRARGHRPEVGTAAGTLDDFDFSQSAPDDLP